MVRLLNEPCLLFMNSVATRLDPTLASYLPQLLLHRCHLLQHPFQILLFLPYPPVFPSLAPHAPQVRLATDTVETLSRTIQLLLAFDPIPNLSILESRNALKSKNLKCVYFPLLFFRSRLLTDIDSLSLDRTIDEAADSLRRRTRTNSLEAEPQLFRNLSPRIREPSEYRLDQHSRICSQRFGKELAKDSNERERDCQRTRSVQK